MAQGTGVAAEGNGGNAVFRGVSQLALDAKGRLAIPAKHREALARRVPAANETDPSAPGAVVVTADPSRCLLVYPRAAWDPIQARLMALSSFNPEIRSLQRLIVGFADDVELDGSGPHSRAACTPRVRIARASRGPRGTGEQVRMWDAAKWNDATARAITFPSGGLPPELDGFSL